MTRFFYATVVGLVGAAFIHLAIVLMLPHLSANDVWRQIEAATERYEPLRLDRGPGAAIAAARTLDPMFAVFTCRYDLADGVFSIAAPENGEFWSVAVFDDFDRILFSANDRIVASGSLDVAVALAPQMRVLQQTPRSIFTNSILTQANRREGFVVVRLFRPDPTWEPVVEAFIDKVDCRPNPL